MNNEQTLREKFEEFLVKNNIVFQKSGEYSSILDFFTTHHRQALEEVEGKVEGCRFVYDKNSAKWNNHNSTMSDPGYPLGYNSSLDDALAIIREEI